MPNKRKKKLNYARHRERWNDCIDCDLCEVRRKVVLGRGQIPADILFIGEAPGSSEDVLGRPFKGPAGSLLQNDILDKVFPHYPDIRYALTNLVGCIPRINGKKKMPEDVHIKACSRRLNEFIKLCKPVTLIGVGKLATDKIPMVVEEWESYKLYSIVHPAAILRASDAHKPLMVQTAKANILEAISEISEKG